MSRPVRSSEFDRYCRTLACPRGHRRSMTFLEGTGPVIEDLSIRDRLLLESPVTRFEQKISANSLLGRLRSLNHDLNGAVAIPRFRTDSMIACGACHDRWPVLVPAVSDLEIVREHPANRVATPLGVERKLADHRGMKVAANVSLRFATQWRERLEMEWENTTTREWTPSAGIKGSVHGVELSASVRRRFEETLRTRRNLVTERQRSVETVIEVVVPPDSSIEVELTWRQMWEVTECDVRVGDDPLRTVYYRVAMEPDFDYVMRQH